MIACDDFNFSLIIFQLFMYKNLDFWLNYIESIHPMGIDMGLDRIKQVKNNLGLNFACPTIVVGGTNGKGSTCTFLEKIYLAAGYQVGLHISPEIIRFNERARINGIEISDELLIEGFEAVEYARNIVHPAITLTYFEFTSLAIMQIFANLKLDVVIFEVGLGGRLDAMNILDHDSAVVTSIDLDHINYLGNNREVIGLEKAGIFRSFRPAICSDPTPPKSIIQYAEKINASLSLINRDFSYQIKDTHWDWNGLTKKISHIPHPGLRGEHQYRNASAALAVIESLRTNLNVSEIAIRKGVESATIKGRFQTISKQPTIILDVGHNPHATTALARNLVKSDPQSKIYALVGMMSDKDISGSVEPLMKIVDQWHCVDLPSTRAAKGLHIKKVIETHSKTNSLLNTIETHDSPLTAYQDLINIMDKRDQLIVFGSFVTVAGILKYLKN